MTTTPQQFRFRRVHEHGAQFLEATVDADVTIQAGSVLRLGDLRHAPGFAHVENVVVVHPPSPTSSPRTERCAEAATPHSEA